ncbi:MAG: MerR family transcriptional regulator [Rhodothalassiaceae bacterium]
MRIGEVARQTGVSVRMLRHYESLGLIAPLRSQAGQRVYDAAQLIRLQQIRSLRRIGLSLSRIAALLAAQAMSLRQALAFHRAVLVAQQRQLREALAITDAVLTQAETIADLPTLCRMINQGEQIMSEQQWQKVYDQFYSEEEQARWRKAKQTVPEAVQRHAEQAWPALIARAQALVGSDPASAQAQQVLAEWEALLEPLKQADPALLESAGRMWANTDQWPADGPEPPISPEVFAFIQATARARSGTAG